MSDSLATAPPSSIVPSSAYLATSEADTDIDDLAPGVDWVAASGKDGRFWLVTEDPKVSLGESLKVVFLHAAPGQTAWVPKAPDKAGAAAHPDLEWFRQIKLEEGRPFCKNRDTKRLAPELSDNLTQQQVAALRNRGYTGNCNGCPFKKWDRESKSSVCRESREILMIISGRDPDHPARMTIDGTSLSPLKAMLKKSFKVKAPDASGKEKLVDLLICSKPISLSFKQAKNDAGQDYYILVAEAPEGAQGFLPEQQVAEFRELREVFLQYASEQNAPQHYVDEPADYEVSTSPEPAHDSPPPLTDADAPVEQTAAAIAARHFS